MRRLVVQPSVAPPNEIHLTRTGLAITVALRGLYLTKKIKHFPAIIVALAVLSTNLSWGQGTIQLNNRLVGVFDARITLPDGSGVGAGFTAQLFGGPEGTPAGSLQALFPTTTFRTSTAAALGYANPVDVSVPGVPFGNKAMLVLRVYNGASFESSSIVFQSPPISVALGGGLLPPAPLTGLQGGKVASSASIGIPFPSPGYTPPNPPPDMEKSTNSVLRRQVTVELAPPSALAAGAGWRLSPNGPPAFITVAVSTNFLMTELDYFIEFRKAKGFIQPLSQIFRIPSNSGDPIVVRQIYMPNFYLTNLLTEPILKVTLIAPDPGRYSLEHSSIQSSDFAWRVIASTNVTGITNQMVIDTAGRPEPTNGFFRARLDE